MQDRVSCLIFNNWLFFCFQKGVQMVSNTYNLISPRNKALKEIKFMLRNYNKIKILIEIKVICIIKVLMIIIMI